MASMARMEYNIEINVYVYLSNGWYVKVFLYRLECERMMVNFIFIYCVW